MFGKAVSLGLTLTGIACAVVSPGTLNSNITILVHNDLLEDTSSLSGSGVLLLDPMPLQTAINSCNDLGESLWTPEFDLPQIINNLKYLVYEGKYTSKQNYWVGSVHGKPSTIDVQGDVKEASADTILPVLCTQTAPFSSKTTQNTSTPWQITVNSNNEQLTGYRDRLSFRFLGIRYGQSVGRWEYSEMYKGNVSNVSALDYGDICLRTTTGSEDCFFLNIWTPYLPASGDQPDDQLKPVMFWIHGGAFTGGSSTASYYDGGNLASRGDVIVVTVEYRLGTLGFLALDDGVTNGNYGISDWIVALQWVQDNIRDFGGDPSRVTIFGQSAGAGAVRALLASSKSNGLFSGGIMQSNLGGLGYGTTYSKYYTISEEMEVVGNSILSEANCTNATSQVDCLKALPGLTITGLEDTARYLVVDGEYVQTSEVVLTDPDSTANVPMMIGVMRDDGAAFIDYPAVNESIQDFLYASDLPSDVAPSSLFPIPNGPNKTLDVFNTSARVSTDGVFRCIDEATGYAGINNDIFPDVYFYEFNRSYQLIGYSPNYPVCQAPTTADYPYGDPHEEYFKCHSGEIYYVFGTLLREGLPFRDDFDLPFEQYVVDSWSSFARTANPSPDLGFLKARGYTNTTAQIESTAPWTSFKSGEYQLRRLQWPPSTVEIDEVPQCQALNVSLNYFST